MKYFLSLPFSSKVDDTGAVFEDYRKEITKLTEAIKSAGHTYFLALEYANWTMGGGPDKDPAAELQHEFDQIDSSDCVIVLLEDRISAGVQLENGYAYARGKKLQIYQIGKPVWSNIAFARIVGYEITSVQSVADFVSQAVEHVKK